MYSIATIRGLACAKEFFPDTLSNQELDELAFTELGEMLEKNRDDFIQAFHKWVTHHKETIADNARFTGVTSPDPRTIVLQRTVSASIGEQRNFAGSRSRIPWILECVFVGEERADEEGDGFYDGPISWWVEVTPVLAT